MHPSHGRDPRIPRPLRARRHEGLRRRRRGGRRARRRRRQHDAGPARRHRLLHRPRRRPARRVVGRRSARSTSTASACCSACRSTAVKPASLRPDELSLVDALLDNQVLDMRRRTFVRVQDVRARAGRGPPRGRRRRRQLGGARAALRARVPLAPPAEEERRLRALGATSTSSRCGSRGSTSWRRSPSWPSCTPPTSPTSSARSGRASARRCSPPSTPASPPTRCRRWTRSCAAAALQEMPLERAAKVLEQIEADEAADILAKLPDTLAQELLARLPGQARARPARARQPPRAHGRLPHDHRLRHAAEQATAGKALAWIRRERPEQHMMTLPLPARRGGAPGRRRQPARPRAGAARRRVTDVHGGRPGPWSRPTWTKKRSAAS